MRIALVSEELLPSSAPTAHVARELATRLSRDHEVLVLTHGRGLPTFHGASVFWAGRMTPVSSVREAMALFRPDVCHLLEPHRLGLKAAEAADRLDIRTLCLPGESWLPGVDTVGHHPGLRDEQLHTRWTRAADSGPGARAAVTVVGYVGSLDRRRVVRRLARLTRLPCVHLVVLGDGPGADHLTGLGAEVVGSASGVERSRCLASFDVLVQPRKRETYAPTVLEALASGVPVVAFDSGAAGLVVRHEHNGLLVDRERGGRALSRAVLRLAASPPLRRSLGRRSRPSVATRTWDHALDQLVVVHSRQAPLARALSG
jgi:hypothetical protein